MTENEREAVREAALDFLYAKDDYSDDFIEAASGLIADFAIEHANPKWIAVSERLPDENNLGKKWITCEGDGFGPVVCEGKYLPALKRWEWIYTQNYYTPVIDGITVTAWMEIEPMPQPYTDSDKGVSDGE